MKNRATIESFTLLAKDKSYFYKLSSAFLTFGSLFGIFLVLWSANLQYKDFKKNQQVLLDYTVNTAALEISELIYRQTQTLNVLLKENNYLLKKIYKGPDKNPTISELNNKLNAFFPDSFGFAIYDYKGNVIFDELDKKQRQLCIDDIEAFAMENNGKNNYTPALHILSSDGHYDLMTKTSHNNNLKLTVILRFQYELLTKILNNHIPGERLLLIRTGIKRENHQDGQDLYKIELANQSDIIYKKVPHSQWKIIGLPDNALYATRLKELSIQYGLLSLLIIFFYLLVLSILKRLNNQRNQAFNQLEVLNQNLESTVINRTRELQKLSTVVTQSPVEIIITDLKGIIEYVNPKFSHITGYSPIDVIGTNVTQFITDKEDKKLIDNICETLLEGNNWAGEFNKSYRKGAEYWMYFRASPIRDGEHKIIQFLFIGEDITEKKIKDQKILYHAHYDGLTGLPNRTLAFDRLEQSIQLSKRSNNKVVLIFIDLDNFKNINDTLGHDYGDLLLKETATRLQTIVRKSDTVARLGGDEFIIILSQITNEEYIDKVAEKIIGTFQEPIITKDSECKITASLGISICPDNGLDRHNLLRAADLAMYYSKDNGRNQYHYFNTELEENAQTYFNIEKHLNHSMEKNEIYVVYQPIVDITTGQVSGCEALIRWNSPELGNISPEVFISIAEQTGFITSIGEFVLKTACSQVAKWKSRYKKSLFIAVNLSPRQFWEKDFIAKIKSSINKSGLSPDNLELEVTEGMIIKNHQETQSIMMQLMKMGIKLSMDDYGTGYSSLYHLKKFHFDKLKIDRSFIKELEGNDDDITLVRTTIEMAHNLGLKVVAEGIENKEQLTILKNIHCDYGQGFYLSEPVMAEEFESRCLHNLILTEIGSTKSIVN